MEWNNFWRLILICIHCWKKKRDFQIIRGKVGGFLTQAVANNEYFVGWMENMVDKYHLKWLPMIC